MTEARTSQMITEQMIREMRGATSCNCIGPQNGEPKCPCMMRGVIKRNGRWVEPEKDLGPVIDR